MRPRVFPAEDTATRSSAPMWRSFNEAAGIPRGRRREHREPTGSCRSFNEAAGIPRGRRRNARGGAGQPDASMRPRVFPAEDAIPDADHFRGNRASMRPRVFPAEDRQGTPGSADTTGGFNEAAGIPRGRLRDEAIHHGRLHASMRPRVFPAEDSRCPERIRHHSSRFNEAAGIPRGRLVVSLYQKGVHLEASMRPRVFPAEDAARTWPCRRRQCKCFNEAAGIPRGRPPGGRTTFASSTLLQ